MTTVTRRARAVAATVVALLALAGCTIERPPGNAPLRYRDAVFSTVTVTRDLQYGSAPDQATGAPVALKLDLYQPTGDTQTGRPAIVWVHGGGYSGGDKSGGPSAELASTFAKLGYVTVSINYRLITTGCSGSNVRNDCVIAAINAQHDAQAAVRWLRAHAATYRIDPARIGIGGESAGAITATLVGLRADDPGDSGTPGQPSNVAAFQSLSGGSPNGAFVSAGDAPGLLFHGTADTVVPFAWSAETARAMLTAGVPVFLQVLTGAGHVPFTAYHDQIVSQSDYFFYDFLDLAHAAGQPVSAARAFDRRVAELRRAHPRYAQRLAQARRELPQYTR